VKADAVAAGLEALAPFVLKRLRNALTSTRRRQGKPGIAWRFQEAYFRPRFEAGLLLDLAGRMRDIKLLPLLKEACGFTDPKLVMFAALAMLRRTTRGPFCGTNSRESASRIASPKSGGPGKRLARRG
jgi:hypothetical protein